MNPTTLYNLSQIPEFNELIFNPDEIKLNILKLNKIEYNSLHPLGGKYKIIRYDKTILSSDIIPTYGLCRSIIINNNNEVVCFAPPKSVSADLFMSNFPIKNESLIAEEFVEGTMINVFWDNSIGLNGAWEIATRNTVGALSSFYKTKNSKTFREMFLEAANVNNLVLDSLNRGLCYSFVLQHPENRIVVPFNQSQLYLVAVYSFDNSDKNNIRVFSYDMNEMKKSDLSIMTTIRFPQIYEDWTTYSDLIDKYASMNSSYNILGVVIYNKENGLRTKIRNPVYEQVRQLRGNQSKLQYQYLCLRKEGKVTDFLKYYPENKKELSNFRDQIHLFTHTIFTNYISCYIKKEKPLIEFSEQYRTHMFNIHQKYINELKEQKSYVTNSVVIKYVNEIHPSLLMYCLNFQMRKRNVDFIEADTQAV
jgi:hypothetical protein